MPKVVTQHWFVKRKNGRVVDITDAVESVERGDNYIKFEFAGNLEIYSGDSLVWESQETWTLDL